MLQTFMFSQKAVENINTIINSEQKSAYAIHLHKRAELYS